MLGKLLLPLSLTLFIPHVELIRRALSRSDVDIYLYNANTEDIATTWRGVQNARGMIGIVPDEEWWPEQSASEWFNRESNVTIPYFFVIVDGGDELTGGETHQSTFTVIRKCLLSSLYQLGKDSCVANSLFFQAFSQKRLHQLHYLLH